MHQGFAHCAELHSAAPRRRLARVPVPGWGIILADALTTVALVSPYPTNYLMVRRLIPVHEPPKCPPLSFTYIAIRDTYPV